MVAPSCRGKRANASRPPRHPERVQAAHSVGRSGEAAKSKDPVRRQPRTLRPCSTFFLLLYPVICSIDSKPSKHRMTRKVVFESRSWFHAIRCIARINPGSERMFHVKHSRCLTRRGQARRVGAGAQARGSHVRTRPERAGAQKLAGSRPAAATREAKRKRTRSNHGEGHPLRSEVL